MLTSVSVMAAGAVAVTPAERPDDVVGGPHVGFEHHVLRVGGVAELTLVWPLPGVDPHVCAK